MTVWCCFYVYDVRSDHLVLDNTSEGSLLGRTTSPVFRNYQLFSGLSVGWAHESSPFHLSTSVVAIIFKLLFRQPCYLGIICIAFLSFLGATISQPTYRFSGSSFFQLSHCSNFKTIEASSWLGFELAPQERYMSSKIIRYFAVTTCSLPS